MEWDPLASVPFYSNPMYPYNLDDAEVPQMGMVAPVETKTDWTNLIEPISKVVELGTKTYASVVQVQRPGGIASPINNPSQREPQTGLNTGKTVIQQNGFPSLSGLTSSLGMGGISSSTLLLLAIPLALILFMKR